MTRSYWWRKTSSSERALYLARSSEKRAFGAHLLLAFTFSIFRGLLNVGFFVMGLRGRMGFRLTTCGLTCYVCDHSQKLKSKQSESNTVWGD